MKEESRSGGWQRLLEFTRPVAILLAVCLVGCCPLAIMMPVATAAADCEWIVMDLELPEGVGIGGMWGSSPSDVWVVGSKGWYFRYDGVCWTSFEPGRNGPNPGPSGYLNDIHGTSESNVFVVGGKYYGMLSWYDGSLWHSLKPDTNGYLSAVWACPEGDVFAVGSIDHTVMVHYDGEVCLHVDTGIAPSEWEVWLADIWASSSSDVFVVGSGGTIIHYDGSTCSSMNSVTTVDLFDVWGASSSDVFAVGQGGTILHYNGSAWSAMDSGTSAHLYSIWGCSPRDVLAVGSSGTVLHYDGVRWSSIAFEQSLGSPNFGIVWASSSSDIFVTSCGIIYHYGPRDDVAPRLTVDDMPAKTENGPLTLSGTATDASSAIYCVEYCVNGGPWQQADCTPDGANPKIAAFSCTVFLSEGSNTVEIRAKDARGNVTGEADYEVLSIKIGEGGFDTWVIIVAAVGGIAIVAGSAYLILRRGRA